VDEDESLLASAPNASHPSPKPIEANSEAGDELAAAIGGHGSYTRYARFVVAVLGSIPWLGGLLAASAALHAEVEQGKINELVQQWLRSYGDRVKQLEAAIGDITDRLDQLGPEARARAESDGYLALVGKAFGVWDKADTNEKRRLLVALLTNAAGSAVAPDDLIRLFIEWIDRYHELHFKVIAEVYKSPGITRREIWLNIHGAIPREDSAEADLFRLLVHDLSTGRVLRQIRATDADGKFLKKKTGGRRRGSATTTTMKSAFDDVEPYGLSALGERFVHYAMNEVVLRIEAERDQSG
jgi:hypothetical protein